MGAKIETGDERPQTQVEVVIAAIVTELTKIYNYLVKEIEDKLDAIRASLTTAITWLTTISGTITNIYNYLAGEIEDKLDAVVLRLNNILAVLTPLAKGSIFNTAVLAATDFFAANLAPTNNPCLFRVYVALSVAGIVSVRRIFGGVTVSEQLNSGNPLLANCAYGFDILVNVGEAINLQTSVAATILKCSVIEVPRGA